MRALLPNAGRHHALRDAAVTMFLRNGYAATTMDVIASRAGVSREALHRVFPSKAALFMAVLDHHLAPTHVDAAIEAEPDAAKALTAILLVIARPLLTAGANNILRLLLSELPLCPDLARAFHCWKLGQGASFLKRRIEAEMARGRLRGSDPMLAADMLLSMVAASISVETMLGLRDVPDDAEIARSVQAAVELFLHGVGLDT